MARRRAQGAGRPLARRVALGVFATCAFGIWQLARKAEDAPVTASGEGCIAERRAGIERRLAAGERSTEVAMTGPQEVARECTG